MYRFIDYKRIYEQESKSSPTPEEVEKAKKATKSGTTFAFPIDQATKEELTTLAASGKGTWQSKEPLKKYVSGREGDAVMINGKPVYLQIRVFSNSTEKENLPIPQPNASQIFVTWDSSAENLQRSLFDASDITNAINTSVKLLDEVQKGNSPEFTLKFWSEDETPVDNATVEKPEESTEKVETTELPAEEIAPGTAYSTEEQPIESKNQNTMAVKSFDQFITESKKKWIADIDMKKGALKKDLGKKKLSKKDVNKELEKLEKKDKDKKKPGLQLDKKDATKQKRLNLAKTLMSLKESLDTVSESKELMLLKKKVADIHKEVEKAIEETTKKK